jgi:hypothetical protein
MSGAATPRTSVRSVQTELRLAQLNPLAGFAFPFRCQGPVPLSLVPSAYALEENLDTGQPFSHRYELRTQHRFGKRRYAHTAADLHVRSGFSNRAGLKNR